MFKTTTITNVGKGPRNGLASAHFDSLRKNKYVVSTGVKELRKKQVKSRRGLVLPAFGKRKGTFVYPQIIEQYLYPVTLNDK